MVALSSQCACGIICIHQLAELLQRLDGVEWPQRSVRNRCEVTWTWYLVILHCVALLPYCIGTRDVPLAKNPSTETAQQRLFLVLKIVFYAVVVISEVLRLSTKSRCNRCARHISNWHYSVQFSKQAFEMAVSKEGRSTLLGPLTLPLPKGVGS